MIDKPEKNEELIFAGTIIRTKGFDGRIALKDTPTHILSVKQGAACRIGFSKSFTSPYKINTWKKTKKEHVFSLENISSKEEAIKLKENAVFVFYKDIIVEEDESYTIGTLLNCSVYIQSTGELIGKVKEVYILPANDVWIIETNNGDLPIPFIEDVVKNVDIDNARIEIEMIEGLEDIISEKSNGK